MMKITDMQSKFMILTNNIKMIRVMVHSMVTVPAVFLSPVVGDKVDCC